jgi:hypothetical protein
MPKNEITDLTRRAIIDYLLECGDPFHGRLDHMEFLRRVWPLSEMPSEDSRFDDAESDIWQHTVNNHDWDHDELLFKRLQIETCSDDIFLKFVETALSPRVVSKMARIEERADAVNRHLARDGYTLVADERVSGWPVYHAQRSTVADPFVVRSPDEFPFSVNELTHTMIELLMNRGQAREVALLTFESGHFLDQTRYDNWNGGTYFWTLTLKTPAGIYARLSTEEREGAETRLKDTANELLRPYEFCGMDAAIIVPVANLQPDIREEARRWLNGEGVNNQGRVRSDNIAAREYDGLLFRSQNEIYLYKALKVKGLPFAPLPVFLRGGEQYKRLEPDFVIVKDGVLLIVEVDGDTVHRELPAVAEQRLRLFTNEGAHVHRVLASQCASDDQAAECVKDILNVIERQAKLK